MMPVDKERLILLIGKIDESLNILKKIMEDGESLFKDPVRMGSVKYYLIVAIEACIDICNHIVAKEHLGTPNSYSGCFDILQKFSIIDEHLASKMTSMAKFRNLLVHLYWEIDDYRVYEILQKNPQDFKEFIKQVSSKYLINDC